MLVMRMVARGVGTPPIAGPRFSAQDLTARCQQFDKKYFGGELLNSGFPFESIFAGLAYQATGSLAVAGLSPEQVARWNDTNQDSDTLAGFGEVTWYFAEDWRLTIGGRYSKESKDVDKLTYLSNNRDGMDIHTQTPNLCAGAAAATTGCQTVSIFSSAFGTNPHQVYDSLDKEFFDPSLKLQWDIDYDNM